MSSQGTRIPLKRGLELANDFARFIKPFVTKCEIAGSIRRQSKTVGDIEIVCIEHPFNSLGNIIYPGQHDLKVNGPRLKRLIWQGSQVDLFVTNESDYGRILAIRTGPSEYSHHVLASRWRELGWVGTKSGLRRLEECKKTKDRWEIKKEIKGKEQKPPLFTTEYEFYDFLRLPWVAPELRMP